MRVEVLRMVQRQISPRTGKVSFLCKKAQIGINTEITFKLRSCAVLGH